MKAIHNECYCSIRPILDAFDSSKIQKWKQFTTAFYDCLPRSLMLLIVQRYKNESNSQPFRRVLFSLMDAFDSSKIQKWKQFTTELNLTKKQVLMLLIVQRYKNESNSQLFTLLFLNTNDAFDSSKIQKWKQFTTR